MKKNNWELKLDNAAARKWVWLACQLHHFRVTVKANTMAYWSSVKANQLPQNSTIQ